MTFSGARILLVYPPSRTQSHFSCPSGILMLAAVLEQSGHEVHILDSNAAQNKKNTADVIRIVDELKPDIVGITLVTPTIREAYKLAGSLQGRGAKLLAGGPHATLLPEEPLSFGFDAVVVGEGEDTIVEAVHALLDQFPLDDVNGLVYRGTDGNPRHTPPRQLIKQLDELPLPARHLVNPRDYGPLENPELQSNIFSSRGCPAKCSYCAGALFGKKFRFRSAESVLQEIFQVHKAYGTTHFHFVDDAMAIDQLRVKTICEGFQNSGLSLTWSMMTRIDTVDEDLLTMVSKAGCVQIEYGVESGCPETLRKIHKPHTVEMVKHVVRMTSDFGIKAYVFFILGFPWEDEASLDDTKKLMIELAPHVACFHPAIASILIPFPSTEIYETYKKQYKFENWWLSNDRNYDAPCEDTHSYFHKTIFPLGAVLDADFFLYQKSVRRKIYEIFKLMYCHDIQRMGRLSQLARHVLISLSEKLDEISPSMERRVFAVRSKGIAALFS